MENQEVIQQLLQLSKIQRLQPNETSPFFSVLCPYQMENPKKKFRGGVKKSLFLEMPLFHEKLHENYSFFGKKKNA